MAGMCSSRDEYRIVWRNGSLRNTEAAETMDLDEDLAFSMPDYCFHVLVLRQLAYMHSI